MGNYQFTVFIIINTNQIFICNFIKLNFSTVCNKFLQKITFPVFLCSHTARAIMCWSAISKATIFKSALLSKKQRRRCRNHRAVWWATSENKRLCCGGDLKYVNKEPNNIKATVCLKFKSGSIPDLRQSSVAKNILFTILPPFYFSTF